MNNGEDIVAPLPSRRNFLAKMDEPKVTCVALVVFENSPEGEFTGGKVCPETANATKLQKIE